MKNLNTLFRTAFLAIVWYVFFPGVLSAQNIYTQNFDASAASLPTGWYTNNNSWTTDSSNFSTGYSGASGKWNAEIQNSSPAGYDSLITNSISTTGYSDITVLWGARNSNHFSDSGSHITGFYWSTDDGATWNNIPYTENGNNSTWSLDNAGAAISLPAAVNNQASLKFLWLAHIVTAPSGTYRIDDFKVAGSPATGIDKVEPAKNLAYVYLINNAAISVALNQSISERVQLELFDISGKVIGRQAMESSTAIMDASQLSPGLYFVRLSTLSETMVTKIVVR
jgi:hypothetical protein